MLVTVDRGETRVAMLEASGEPAAPSKSPRSRSRTKRRVNEVPDGHDAIEWITRQPWSNRDVGMWGDSYYGFTQWAAVAAQHPALKAIVPRVTIADIDTWL